MFSSKQIIMAILVLVLLVGGGIFAVSKFAHKAPPAEVPPPAPTTPEEYPVHEVLGLSVESRPIDAYTYGKGSTTLVFVGGMHGGYEWNSVVLAYDFMDYLKEHPESIPSEISISVIPDANPDGVFKVTGKVGRFAISDVMDVSKKPAGYGRTNAHDVDLNRNFDCNWKSKGTWRGNTVSAGTKAFSEPEAAALRDFLLAHRPSAVVFWHSQSNAVYASECNGGILPATLTLMDTYAKASGYPAVKSFDAYEVTGDAEGWLASVHIPAVTVELKTHETVEWERNLAGILAVIKNSRALHQ